jgi:hypothetical protein
VVTDQHERYMAGYGDHQRELAGGLKSPATDPMAEQPPTPPGTTAH